MRAFFALSLVALASSGLAAQGSFIITTASLPDGVIAGQYSTQVTASGGAFPYTWSALHLDDLGLRIDSTSGVISGIGANFAAATVTITATDNIGAQASKDFRVRITRPLAFTDTLVLDG